CRVRSSLARVGTRLLRQALATLLCCADRLGQLLLTFGACCGEPGTRPLAISRVAILAQLVATGQTLDAQLDTDDVPHLVADIIRRRIGHLPWTFTSGLMAFSQAIEQGQQAHVVVERDQRAACL